MTDNVYLPTFVNGGSITYPPGGSFGPRVQQTYLLVMLHSGRLDLSLDDIVTQYEAGTTVLVMPGQRCFFRFATDQPTRHSWINVGYEPTPQTLAEQLTRLPKSVKLSKRMIEITREMEHWSKSPWKNMLLQAIGHHAISLFTAEAQEDNIDQCETNETLMLARRYVYRNYAKGFQMTDMAAFAFVSPSHLCRLFKENLQKSPMAFVWEVRTEQALNLLASTGLSVVEVANRCGFKNSVHMHRRIKLQTGLSPTEYRKQFWAVD